MRWSWLLAAWWAASSLAQTPPGDYTWRPQLAPQGPVLVVVSLPEQRLVVYRNGVAIGDSPVSSGRSGHETPPGVYTILGKEREHRSNLYDDAPMPFMQRLSWDGVALHAGTLPGRPASHGCIRLPAGFAERLFATTRVGDTVIVADTGAAPALVHPPLQVPESAGVGGATSDGESAAYRWDDDAAPDGPLTAVASLTDRRMRVYRGGAVLGEAVLQVRTPRPPEGSVLFVVGDGYAMEPSALDPRWPRHLWQVLPLSAPAPDAASLRSALALPPGFAQHLYAALRPGSTVLVTGRSAAHDRLADCAPLAPTPAASVGTTR